MRIIVYTTLGIILFMFSLFIVSTIFEEDKYAEFVKKCKELGIAVGR